MLIGYGNLALMSPRRRYYILVLSRLTRSRRVDITTDAISNGSTVVARNIITSSDGCR